MLILLDLCWRPCCIYVRFVTAGGTTRAHASRRNGWMDVNGSENNNNQKKKTTTRNHPSTQRTNTCNTDFTLQKLSPNLLCRFHPVLVLYSRRTTTSVKVHAHSRDGRWKLQHGSRTRKKEFHKHCQKFTMNWNHVSWTLMVPWSKFTMLFGWFSEE